MMMCRYAGLFGHPHRPASPTAHDDEAPVTVGGDRGLVLVPETGLEPATFCSGGRRSIR